MDEPEYVGERRNIFVDLRYDVKTMCICKEMIFTKEQSFALNNAEDKTIPSPDGLNIGG